MFSREITTRSEFFSSYFDALLKKSKKYRTITERNIRRGMHGDKLIVENDTDFEACKTMFQLLNDSVGEKIIAHFKKIPVMFYYDLFFANRELSDAMKAEICRHHFAKIRGIVKIETTIKPSDRPGIFHFEHQFEAEHMRYPAFFEEGCEIFLRADRENYIPVRELLNFSEEFFIRNLEQLLRTHDNQASVRWVAVNDIRELCVHMSWDFIERYILPIVLELQSPSRQRSIVALIAPTFHRGIIPRETLEQFLESYPETYLALFETKILTQKLFAHLKRDIFDRLDYDEEFARQFTYDTLDDVKKAPFSRASLDRTDIPHNKIVKAMFTCYLIDLIKVDATEGDLERLVTENYELIIALAQDEFNEYFNDYEYHFCRDNFSSEFYREFYHLFSDDFWKYLCGYYGNPHFWRDLFILNEVRRRGTLADLLQNPHITLDIIQALGELTSEEVLILANNSMTTQKALENERLVAEYAEEVGLDIPNPAYRRALTGLREARSLYPR